MRLRAYIAFHAGLESWIEQRGLRALARLRPAGFIDRLEGLIPLLLAARRLTRIVRIEAEIAPYAISTEIETVAHGSALFEQALSEDAFAALPEPLRAFHGSDGHPVWWGGAIALHRTRRPFSDRSASRSSADKAHVPSAISKRLPPDAAGIPMHNKASPGEGEAVGVDLAGLERPFQRARPRREGCRKRHDRDKSTEAGHFSRHSIAALRPPMRASVTCRRS
ncbi:hypothetical protein [Hansschlegelia zhihuaiae]|uniref:Uncharacterized protein n=1 Tax=Hansschlegelia zhihuaiae TaxID=405005 RepID=A0A4Q0MGU3_9HYPH|nr:hypothetical protein [Hansschlegelia zhihuaiae]RXF72688.1 hypothetical protein EK403_14075 [Hansschlegelia zhihuaiae]